MPTLRTLTLALALTGLFSNSLYAADAKADSAQPVRVLASLPITFGLGEMLLKDSGVVLERAAAANLPGSRQTAYFTGRGADALRGLANNADAVIGLRSIWADDPLYPTPGAAIFVSSRLMRRGRWTVVCRALLCSRGWALTG